MKVSIVIAAQNEAATVGDVIAGCKPFADEILLVDGHSTDGTREIAEKAGARILTDGGRGKGDAIRSAIPHIRGEIAVFIDADGSHDPRDIPALIEPIRAGRADHVSASRLMGGSEELHGSFEEFFRLMGSSLITALINWRFKTRLSESQNGFRAIRTDVLRELGLAEDITTIEQEMIVKTLRRGFRMAETPSREHARKHGVSHIRLGEVWFRYGWSLFKLMYL